MPLNLVKLSVGTKTVEDLIVFRDSERGQRWQTEDGLPRHVTRMWPKREAELLQGGSIYWVIGGLIQCRQKLTRLDEVIGEDGIRRCAIVMAPEIIRTASAPKRAFQGWRYLPEQDAPPDLTGARNSEETLPADLSAALADIGVL